MQTATKQPNDGEPGANRFFDEPTVSTEALGNIASSNATFSFAGFRVPDSDGALKVYETKALARTIIQKRQKTGEWESLLAERQELLDKKFAGKMTVSDSNRLDYVRWSLDQIEDARHGAALDMLESSVARYESFLEGVEQLNRELINNRTTHRR